MIWAKSGHWTILLVSRVTASPYFLQLLPVKRSVASQLLTKTVAAGG
jgi:hypothetical protein